LNLNTRRVRVTWLNFFYELKLQLLKLDREKSNVVCSLVYFSYSLCHMITIHK
jgi:hypothetical protein